MSLVRDNDAERQTRIDQLVRELVDAQRTGAARRAALLARALADLQAIPTTAKPNQP